MAALLENGGSLSGRERNCCFLNTGGTKFADISAAAGFDFPDDTRSVSLSDWDQDGDLDVWMTNRSAPRVRFLQNAYDSGHQAVSIKLQGVQSNRDGIGARVELRLGSGEGKLMKTLRAGEGYLGQASKWMHFGLGTAAIQQAAVRWPSGRSEVFRGVTAGGRFILVEGRGTAVRQPMRNTQLPLASAPADAPPDKTDAVRLVVPARLPMPAMAYRDLIGREVSLTNKLRGPLLINLWSTACQPCLEELAVWSKRQPDFEATGVHVVLLCVDGSTTQESKSNADAVQQLVDRMKLPFAVGLATPELLDALDIAQQVLTRRIRTLPVPTSFLMDRQGRLAVVYKGPAAADQVLADIGQLELPADRHRDLAISFPGSWYTLPFPPDLMAIPEQYRKLGQPERAFRYLKRNVPASLDSPSSKAFFKVTSPQSLAAIYIDLAKELGNDKQAAVIEALQAAAQLQPRDGRPRMALAMILQQAGRPGDAVLQYREFLKHNPDDLVIANNLAWLLATCNVAQVRRPDEAIQLAQIVCEKSRRKLPSALDTLAAAYAAAGRFDDAVATISEAISLLDSAGQADYSAAMRERLNLYQRRQAYIEKR